MGLILKPFLPLYLVLRSPFREKFRGGLMLRWQLTRQLYFTGVQAFGLVSLSALGLGGAMIFQMVQLMGRFGVDEVAESLLAQLLVRDIGPLMVALIVIARSGTAMTTEIGNMKVNEEIRALEAMGVDVPYLIVLPRCLAGALATAVLTAYFSYLALLGGYVMTLNNYPTFLDWLTHVFSLVGVRDVAIAGGKGLLLGLALGLICCLHGMAVTHSFTQVPQKATRAVVVSIATSFILNLVITVYTFPWEEVPLP